MFLEWSSQMKSNRRLSRPSGFTAMKRARNFAVQLGLPWMNRASRFAAISMDDNVKTHLRINCSEEAKREKERKKKTT